MCVLCTLYFLNFFLFSFLNKKKIFSFFLGRQKRHIHDFKDFPIRTISLHFFINNHLYEAFAPARNPYESYKAIH